MTPRAQDNKATRQRHFLCLETFAGKVFLKWCTQCHTWKNLELYMPEEGPTEVRTFCQVCHERQILAHEPQEHPQEEAQALRSLSPSPRGHPPPCSASPPAAALRGGGWPIVRLDKEAERGGSSLSQQSLRTLQTPGYRRGLVRGGVRHS